MKDFFNLKVATLAVIFSFAGCSSHPIGQPPLRTPPKAPVRIQDPNLADIRDAYNIVKGFVTTVNNGGRLSQKECAVLGGEDFVDRVGGAVSAYKASQGGILPRDVDLMVNDLFRKQSYLLKSCASNAP